MVSTRIFSGDIVAQGSGLVPGNSSPQKILDSGSPDYDEDAFYVFTLRGSGPVATGLTLMFRPSDLSTDLTYAYASPSTGATYAASTDWVGLVSQPGGLAAQAGAGFASTHDWMLVRIS